MQYQKLIDSRPASGDDSSGQLDPQLGYQLLVHGAIHCLPFLAKMLQSKKCAELSDVTDDALENCGVKSEADRRAISKAILEYTRFMGEPEKCRECCEEWATADGADARSAEANAIMGNSSSASPPSDDGEMMAECVVCMESSVSLYIANENLQIDFNFNSPFTHTHTYTHTHSVKSYSCLVAIFAVAWTATNRWSTAQCVDRLSIDVLK